MIDWVIALPHWVVSLAFLAFFCLVGLVIAACLSYREEDWFQGPE